MGSNAAVILAKTTLAHVPARCDRQARSCVVMLGTGTPNADPDRDGPSLAVVVDEASYLVNLGVGVVRREAADVRFPALAEPGPLHDQVRPDL